MQYWAKKGFEAAFTFLCYFVMTFSGYLQKYYEITSTYSNAFVPIWPFGRRRQTQNIRYLYYHHSCIWLHWRTPNLSSRSTKTHSHILSQKAFPNLLQHPTFFVLFCNDFFRVFPKTSRNDKHIQLAHFCTHYDHVGEIDKRKKFDTCIIITHAVGSTGARRFSKFKEKPSTHVILSQKRYLSHICCACFALFCNDVLRAPSKTLRNNKYILK